MRTSMFVRSLGLGLVLGLAITSPARADETKEPQRTAWPVVLAATGAALAGTSAYFFVQWSEFQDRGDVIARRVPKNEGPCDGNDPEFCSVDSRARVAAALAFTTGLASLAAFGSAIAIYAIEGKPSRTAIAPLVAPGVGGAAFVTVF